MTIYYVHRSTSIETFKNALWPMYVRTITWTSDPNPVSMLKLAKERVGSVPSYAAK